MSVKLSSILALWKMHETKMAIKYLSVRFIAKINLRFVEKLSKYFEKWVRIYWVLELECSAHRSKRRNRIWFGLVLKHSLTQSWEYLEFESNLTKKKSDRSFRTIQFLSNSWTWIAAVQVWIALRLNFDKK